jgi:hypothetical protein
LHAGIGRPLGHGLAGLADLLVSVPHRAHFLMLTGVRLPADPSCLIGPHTGIETVMLVGEVPLPGQGAYWLAPSFECIFILCALCAQDEYAHAPAASTHNKTPP